VPVHQRVGHLLPIVALGAVVAHAVSFNFPLGDRLVGAVFQDEPLGQFLRLPRREQGKGEQGGCRDGEPSPHIQHYLASRDSALVRCGLLAAKARKMESGTMGARKMRTWQSVPGIQPVKWETLS